MGNNHPSEMNIEKKTKKEKKKARHGFVPMQMADQQRKQFSRVRLNSESDEKIFSLFFFPSSSSSSLVAQGERHARRNRDHSGIVHGGSRPWLSLSVSLALTLSLRLLLFFLCSWRPSESRPLAVSICQSVGLGAGILARSFLFSLSLFLSCLSVLVQESS